MSKSSRKKKKIHFKKAFWVLLFALLALLGVLGGWLYARSDDKDILNPPVINGQKQTISFKDECVEAQRILDNILLEHKKTWQLLQKSKGTKELPVPETGGAIQVVQREIGVGVPESLTPKAGALLLKKKIMKAGLEYIDGAEALYNGKYEGFKCNIGFKVRAGNGTRNVTVDSVHFFNNLNLSKTSQEKGEVKPRHQFSGKLAIVVDDCGENIELVRSLLNIDIPFSFSILPNKKSSSAVLTEVTGKRRVALLHLPMEPLNRKQMSEGENTIVSEMSKKEMAKLTEKHLQGLQGVAGVSNHQGSKITANAEQMQAVLEVVKEKGLFFLDSRTNSETVARDVARKMKVPTCMNDKFLDNSTEIEAIREEVYKVLALADRNHTAIAICHVRPNTVAMWQKYAKEFKATGITFVPVNELLY